MPSCSVYILHDAVVNVEGGFLIYRTGRAANELGQHIPEACVVISFES